MRGTSVLKVEELQDWNVDVKIDDVYVPARPIGHLDFVSRLKIAWMVFTGKADALLWPKNQ